VRERECHNTTDLWHCCLLLFGPNLLLLLLLLLCWPLRRPRCRQDPWLSTAANTAPPLPPLAPVPLLLLLLLVPASKEAFEEC
jgi:hypothetical protein